MKFVLCDSDYDDMHHALGRPFDTFSETHRNYFCCEAGGDTAKRFEASGCWDFVRNLNSGRDSIYCVNTIGKRLLVKWLSKEKSIFGAMTEDIDHVTGKPRIIDAAEYKRQRSHLNVVGGVDK